MQNPRSLSTRLTHLLKHWPADPVRPAAVSIQTYLQHALGQKPDVPTKKNQPPPRQPVISESSADALQSLLDNRFARRYPIPKHIRYPASDPEHYDNLIREFEEAPNRDWLGRLRKRLSGMIRL